MSRAASLSLLTKDSFNQNVLTRHIE